MTRRGTNRLYAKVAVLASLLIGLMSWSATSEAAEQTCGLLGVNCVCARSLSTTAWVPSSVADFYYEVNQDTSDAKLCSPLTVDGRATVWMPGGAPAVSTGLKNLAAIVAPGNFVVEPSAAQRDTLTGRLGIRYYMKLSTDYGSTDPSGSPCSNDKYTQLGDYLTAYTTGYTSSNSGGFSPTISPPGIAGKWMRVEHYLDTYSNPTTHTFYIKNITDGTPEQSFSVPTRLALDRTALTGFTHIVHKYRAGACAGYATIMYAIMAHWPTNSGQRIGPALELEGGAAATASPPTGVILR